MGYLAQTTISFFAYMTEKLLKGAAVALFLILIHMICQVNNVKFDM